MDRGTNINMSIYNTLRSLPAGVAEMLMKNGFVKDLTPEERDRMEGCLSALTEEWFGASMVKEEKPKKEKKTKAAVVTAPPGTIDRAYLETRTVSELKELGKECAEIKGRKPRAELIDLVLKHLSGSSPVEAPAAAEEASEGSDEELREEPPPVEEKPAKKEKKAKAEKPVKEKKAKPAKKEKKEEAKAAEESPAESEDENTVELKSWYHPNEMTKPIGERRKYFIDPKTNELFHPDRLQDGEAEWRWDEDSGEIIPL
jgi:hypothetical protein